MNYMVSWVFDKQRERRGDRSGRCAELPEKQENKSSIYQRYPTWSSCLVLVIIDRALPVCANLVRSLTTTGFVLDVAHAFVTIHEASSA